MKKIMTSLCALMTLCFGMTAGAATYPATESVAVPDRTMHFEYPAVNNNVEITQEANNTLVYEFDLKMDDNVCTTVAYYGGSSLGPSFIFDANDPNYDGQVVVKFAYGQDRVEVNGNHAYAYYNVGATAHVIIETALTDTGIGDSIITVTPATPDDRPYFLQAKDETVVERHPTNNQEGGRVINGRNLQDKKLLTVKYTAEFEETVVDRSVTAAYSNAELYIKGEEDTPVSEITFDKKELIAGETVTATINVTDKTSADIMFIALYDSEGALKDVVSSSDKAASDTGYNVSYTLSQLEEGDYIKAFLWESPEEMKPISSAAILGK